MANAADRKQIKLAENQEQRREDQWRGDLKTLLALTEFRRFLNRLLSELQPSVPYWSSNPGHVNYHATRHDVGLLLKQQIMEADPDALVAMAIEMRAEEKQEELERLALRTKSVKEQPEESGKDE